MITKQDLDRYKMEASEDYKPEQLTDISDIRIDGNKTVVERIEGFFECVGNPYVFRVGQTPVKVVFSSKAPTLQECLVKVMRQNA